MAVAMVGGGASNLSVRYYSHRHDDSGRDGWDIWSNVAATRRLGRLSTGFECRSKLEEISLEA